MTVHEYGLTTADAGQPGEANDAGIEPGGTGWTRRDPDLLREILAALRQPD